METRPLVTADIPLGTQLPSLSMKYSTDMFKLGEVKTLHNDHETARVEGLPRAVAVAPQVSALIFRMMTECFGGGWIVGGKGSLTYRRPVWSDDFATAHAVVTDKSPEGGFVRVTCNVWVERSDGERAVVGSCSALCDATNR
jgi:acyl dehydratase